MFWIISILVLVIFITGLTASVVMDWDDGSAISFSCLLVSIFIISIISANVTSHKESTGKVTFNTPIKLTDKIIIELLNGEVIESKNIRNYNFDYSSVECQEIKLFNHWNCDNGTEYVFSNDSISITFYK